MRMGTLHKKRVFVSHPALVGNSGRHQMLFLVHHFILNPGKKTFPVDSDPYCPKVDIDPSVRIDMYSLN